MSDSSLVLRFAGKAVLLFSVLCLRQIWMNATPILLAEARKDIHQKPETVVELKDQRNAPIITGNYMAFLFTGQSRREDITEFVASETLEKTKTKLMMLEEEKQNARILVDHLDYAAARTHPPIEP
ncbi:hypothetical protein KP509_25G021900 [Ceratopteris richardii]|uniref:Uncharacterized protein n=1 Tax=Ceratopteris richardii TaxID=49495 RepID=A0A8T2RPG3_CERRI|nr:hypothetical protein KP509_25G021900 [Ceratopteris richardii]